jgi:hypothetical protein
MKQNQRMKNRNIVFAMILFGLVCFGLPQRAQAIVAAPDGGYAGGNTAEGHTDLLNLTVSSYNTGIGLFSPSSNTGGNFNTAIGAGAFLANISAENTGAGAGVHLSDILVSLLMVPWLVRALASAKAIWRALTDCQKSVRKKEPCALADLRLTERET